MIYLLQSSSRHAENRAPKGGSGLQMLKLLDQLRQALHSCHYSPRTAQTYCHRAKRYIDFHNVYHSAEMAEAEIKTFLPHPAVRDKDWAYTQNRAP